jgi:response regulator RpfG family c-di-GMP phosphodiesterase
VRPRIICVDDEPRVLKGLRRTLGRDFDLEVAESGHEALRIMRASEPFQVVVSDMRMPTMNGAQLLATVRTEFPDAARVLLTGQSDLQDAIAAVNEGNIFRFLSKPCPPEILHTALEDAVEHNRLIRSERELLDETVRGSVGLLAEILAIRDPAAAAKGIRHRDHVSALAEVLEIAHPWDIEVAATLSEIGYALIPSDIVDRWRDGEELTVKEQELIERQPRVARDLVAKIPRLESVADILEALAPGSRPSPNHRVQLAVDLIHAAAVYDGYLRGGLKEGAAVSRMRSTHNEIPDEILDGLEHLAVAAGGYAIRSWRASDLVSGVRLAEDLYSADGRLLLTAGAEVTLAAKTRITQFADHVGIREPIKVRVPI